MVKRGSHRASKSGQAIAEFIVMLAALTAVGFLIMNSMIGSTFNPSDLRNGAIGQGQDSTAAKSATVNIARDKD